MAQKGRGGRKAWPAVTTLTTPLSQTRVLALISELAYYANMQIAIVTAMPCDDAFNMLNGSMDVYRDQDAEEAERTNRTALPEPSETDLAVNARALLPDALAHEAWASGYLTITEQDLVNDVVANCRPRFRPRLGARNGQLELLTPAAADRIGETARREYRLDYPVYEGRRASNPVQRPLAFETFIKLADDAVIDWTLRTQNAAFELRRCLQCDDYFIPRRAGRGRFCSDSCRAAYSQHENAFRCAFCARTLTHREYSGLVQVDRREPPCDLLMEAYHRRVRFDGDDRVCIDCVIEHRPAWGRYVFAADAAARERA